MKICTLVLILFSSSLAFSQSGATMQIPIAEYQQMLMQQNSGQGCLQNMLQQVNDGATQAYEIQQNQTNNLMGIAEKYYEHAKTCDNELYKHLDEWEKAKLEHKKNKNMLSIKIRRQELEYRKALHQVERECEANSTEQWQTYKEQMSSGIDNNPVNLIGKNQRLNNMRPLFYDGCMAKNTTIDQIQDLSDEMKLNIEEVYAGFDNSVDTMRSVTERLRRNQELSVKQCLQGREQLEYQEAMIRNQNAAAESHMRKQNLMGLLGAAYTCFNGAQQQRPPASNDATDSSL